MMHGPNLAPRTDFGGPPLASPPLIVMHGPNLASTIYLAILILLAISSMLSIPAVETPTLIRLVESPPS